VFARDGPSGALTFVERHADGIAGDDGLGGASSVAESPDGRHVYVSGFFDDAVAHFRVITCSDGFVDAGEQCDDGNALSGDCCSATCQFESLASPCPDDGDPCTQDQCDGTGTCAHPVGNNGAPCSDGDACTAGEMCSGGTCSGGAAVACPLCETCVSATGCIVGPRSGCKAPIASQKGFLQLKDRTPNTSDLVKWKWTKGAATTLAELGDPLSTSDYGLCVFDAGDALVLQLIAPGGGSCAGRSCWTPLGGATPVGYRYKDPYGTPDGIQSVALKSGAAGVAKASLKGKGAGLPMPVLGAFALPLKAQLQARGGACLESTFSTPLRNTSAEFACRSD
jgi:cysteine-rich repeat protein